jgi:hypothetical protein
MTCSRIAAGLTLLLLAGCAPAPAKPTGSAAPQILKRSSTWRTLCADPRAVPDLIAALANPDEAMGRQAELSLERLTHVKPPTPSSGRVADYAPAWQSWWEREKKAAPRPLGYVEARRLEAVDGLGGTVYIVYDLDDRPLGHVTERGRGVRYGAGAEGPSETLGPAPVPDLLARLLLGVSVPLRIYDPQGIPAGLP